MNTKKYSKLIDGEIFKRFFRKISRVISSFSVTEKLVFSVVTLIFVVSAVLLLTNINRSFLVEIPDHGGTINEGLIGTPRFINPIIAASSADKDLTALIYSGLMRKTPDGELIPDLAERYEVSEDGLEHRFFIRDNAKFHDGNPVTADDIIFTILKAQDPELDSRHRPNWEGVVLEKINDKEVLFRLKQPFAEFAESTTIGILPRHLWENILSGGFSLSKYNTEPIGSGPYELDDIKRDSADIPTSYTLRAFKEYTLGKPFITKINFHLARNEAEIIEMFESKEIDSFGGLSPKTANEIDANIIQLPLPRIFGIFFNQNEAKILAEKSVREALKLATPKETLVNDVLFGFAEVSDNAIPAHLSLNEEIGGSENSGDSATSTSTTEAAISTAKEKLGDAGWELNEDGFYIKETDEEKLLLSLSISTSNIPELVGVAEKVVESWRSIGVDASLKVFEISDLNQNVIRPRNFETLLFGMVIDNYADLYAFWHSSQRSDPGLNVTGYANITTDSLLEDLRSVNNKAEQLSVISQFNAEIKNDVPAIFLYTPKFVYVVSNKISGIEVDNIKNPEDRFMNIHKWFIKTDKVWKIFE